MSLYQKRIQQAVPHHDPRHIEAYMRAEFGTLDHLSPQHFDSSARRSATDVDLDVRLAEDLAVSYGL